MKTEITVKQKEHATKIQATMVVIAKNHIQLGQQLNDAKNELGHGEFIPMIESIGLNIHKANEYMRLSSLQIVEISTLSLASFNNSQLKKLEKMPKEEAMTIIENGVFPKQPKHEDVIDAEIDEEENTDELVALKTENDSLKHELDALNDANDFLQKKLDEALAEIAELKMKVVKPVEPAVSSFSGSTEVPTPTGLTDEEFFWLIKFSKAKAKEVIGISGMALSDLRTGKVKKPMLKTIEKIKAAYAKEIK